MLLGPYWQRHGELRSASARLLSALLAGAPVLAPRVRPGPHPDPGLGLPPFIRPLNDDQCPRGSQPGGSRRGGLTPLNHRVLPADSPAGWDPGMKTSSLSQLLGSKRSEEGAQGFPLRPRPSRLGGGSPWGHVDTPGKGGQGREAVPLQPRVLGLPRGAHTRRAAGAGSEAATFAPVPHPPLSTAGAGRSNIHHLPGAK